VHPLEFLQTSAGHRSPDLLAVVVARGRILGDELSREPRGAIDENIEFDRFIHGVLTQRL
jgi:hypothetical protein